MPLLEAPALASAKIGKQPRGDGPPTRAAKAAAAAERVPREAELKPLPRGEEARAV